MEILLLGCSFGVPTYNKLDCVHQHTEFKLKDLGYTVHNCSRDNIGNLEILSRAKEYLQRNPISHNCCHNSFDHVHLMRPTQSSAIDWVVWFHTELFRDANNIKDVTNYLEKDHDIIAKHVYACYASFFKDLGAKLIVIGGAGDLHHCFYDYIQPEYCMPSWRRHILKQELPLSNTLWQSNQIDKSFSNNAIKLKIVEDNLVIKHELKNSALFPDNCHPGPECHEDITNVIHKVIQSSGSSR